jgi:hypothetical protein
MSARIQRSRAKGWRMPPGAVYVGRGTAWGNPFRIGSPSGYQFEDGGDPTPMIAALTREQSIAFYRDAVRGFLTPEMHPWGHRWMTDFKRRMGQFHPADAARSLLRGKTLVCWCPLDQPCHADVLIAVANGLKCEAVGGSS